MNKPAIGGRVAEQVGGDDGFAALKLVDWCDCPSQSQEDGTPLRR
jgi:hypothetical protein